MQPGMSPHLLAQETGRIEDEPAQREDASAARVDNDIPPQEHHAVKHDDPSCCPAQPQPAAAPARASTDVQRTPAAIENAVILGGRDRRCGHIRGPKLTDTAKDWLKQQVHAYARTHEHKPERAWCMQLYKRGLQHPRELDERNHNDSVLTFIKNYIKDVSWETLRREHKEGEDIV
jgi:hypothetical protein